MTVLRQIPNILTLSRIPLAIAYPFVPIEWRLPIILTSLATEFLDGFLSRTFEWKSRFGALMDPIADKSFVFSVTFTMFFSSDLTWWQFLGIGVRDITVFLGALIVALQGNWKAFLHVNPRILGKLATTAQFGLLMFHAWKNWIPVQVMWVTIVLSCLAGIDYLYLLFKKDFYREYQSTQSNDV